MVGRPNEPLDVAAADGWKSPETLRRCHQQPDDASVRRVVLEPVALWERRAGERTGFP